MQKWKEFGSLFLKSNNVISVKGHEIRRLEEGYKAFELKIEKDLKDYLFKRCVSYGKNKIRDDKTVTEEFLREVCSEGTIDRTVLTEKYFRINQHSHISCPSLPSVPLSHQYLGIYFR